MKEGSATVTAPLAKAVYYSLRRQRLDAMQLKKWEWTEKGDEGRRKRKRKEAEHRERHNYKMKGVN